MSNMAIKSTLLLLAPEFASRSDEDLELMINMTKPQVSEAVYKDSYYMAVALLTAHRFSVVSSSGGSSDSGSGSGVGAARGPLLSEKEGDLQRTYGRIESGSTSGSPTALSTTSYGLLFSELKRSYVFSPMLGM